MMMFHNSSLNHILKQKTPTTHLLIPQFKILYLIKKVNQKVPILHLLYYLFNILPLFTLLFFILFHILNLEGQLEHPKHLLIFLITKQLPNLLSNIHLLQIKLHSLPKSSVLSISFCTHKSNGS